MNYTEDNMYDKPLIIIEEKPDHVEGQLEGETPVITIEHTDDETVSSNTINVKPRRRMPWIVGTAVITILICASVALGYWYYRYYTNIGISVSVTSEQNIAKLQRPSVKETPEVVMTSDTILGVGMNMYELRGLRAEISFEQPDTTDTDVYLYSRCSDFTSYDPTENHYIGSLVVEGKELESEVSRMGYCAMANGNVVIGVARDEDVKDYCIEQGGSFFRQFILVSNGVIPSRFFLHGKVERRGIARMGDKLYYIETHSPEVMWAFADAIREYGFTDAIYITGGNDYCYYRDATGALHDIGDVSRKGTKHKGEGIVPWLVFRKR